ISERFKSAGYKVIRIPETSMIHLEDSTSMNTYWRKHIWYAKGKAAMFVNGYKMDLDFLISILLFLSIISIFSIGKFVLVGMLLLLGGYFYKESVKYFTLFNSLKITIVEVISTLLRALLLPFLILVQCLRKL
ncbi:MAG: hypothetical protein U9Q92_03520, partial [archaeon]|nr:hypothetical protein [archaeon]